MALWLNERIIKAAGKLSIDPDDIVNVTNLSRARTNYVYCDVFREDKYRHGQYRCLMIDYRKYSSEIVHCFVCDNGFVVEYVEDESFRNFPKHYDIYNIMILYNMGLTQKDIAKAFNTSTTTIGHRMKIIKQILEVASIDDIDPEDTIKIKYEKYYTPYYTPLRLSDLSNRLQKIIDKYERRKNDGKNDDNE